MSSPLNAAAAFVRSNALGSTVAIRASTSAGSLAPARSASISRIWSRSRSSNLASAWAAPSRTSHSGRMRSIAVILRLYTSYCQDDRHVVDQDLGRLVVERLLVVEAAERQAVASRSARPEVQRDQLE